MARNLFNYLHPRIIVKRSSKIAIISGIAVAVIISGIALTVHYRLAAIEGNEVNRNESASQIANEIVGNITGSKEHSEASESPEQRAKEMNP